MEKTNKVWWLAVDFDGTEKISTNPDGFERFDPKLYREHHPSQVNKIVSYADTQKEYPIWIEKHDYDPSKIYYEKKCMELPKGTIERMTGIKLTWNDNQIKITND